MTSQSTGSGPSDTGWAGKVVVVTGSTRGFGAVLARFFLEAGAALVINGRSQKGVEAMVNALSAPGRRVTGCAGDSSRLEDMEALAATAEHAFGRIDVWINNAALSNPAGPTMEVPLEDFLRITRCNTLGAYFGSRVALERMTAQGQGTLVNIYGRGDNLAASPYQNAYASSKAWLRQFTRTLHAEYGKRGISILGFNPGLMLTDMVHELEVVDEETKSWLSVFPTVLRILADPPEVPARRLVALIERSRAGGRLNEERLPGPFRILKGLLRELMHRLLRRKGQSAIRITLRPRDDRRPKAGHGLE